MNNLGNKETMAKNLNYYMMKNSVSRTDVCKAIDVSYTTFREWVTGSAYPRIDKIEMLAKFFGITKSDLIEERASTQKIVAVRIPVLGHVHAGIPIDAIEDILDYEEISPQMAMTGEYFGLKVKGDCMAPRIFDGDVVIVKKQSDADSGEIVVAMVGDAAEIKKLVKYDDGTCALAPLNPVYPAKRCENITIIGKVVELRAKL